MLSTTPKNMLKASNINHLSNRFKICSSVVWNMLTVLCNDFNCLLGAFFFKNRSFVTVKQFLIIPLLLVQANPFCLHEFAYDLDLCCKWQPNLYSSVSGLFNSGYSLKFHLCYNMHWKIMQGQYSTACERFIWSPGLLRVLGLFLSFTYYELKLLPM